MADNYSESTQTTTTTTFASDEIAGVQYPRTKVTFGVDGTATDVSAANPLPVVGEFPEFPIEMSVTSLPEVTLDPDTEIDGLKKKIWGEDPIKDVMKTESRWGTTGPVNASGVLLAAPGRFSGFICTASSSGVIRFWNNNAASGTKILDSMAVTAGQVVQIPGGSTPFSTGLYFELVSGTATITPFFNS